MESIEELPELTHGAPEQATKRGWLKRQRRSLLILIVASVLLGALAYLRWFAPVSMLRATLLAPFPGLITRRLREPGDTVSVGTTVLRLVDTEHVYVSAWVDETMLGHLREGQSAQIMIPGRAEPTPAIVDRVGWESDRQSHELLVDVTPTEPLGRIAMGQRADVWIATRAKKDVVAIPTSYVRRDPAGAYCYVDRAGRIEKARVRLGIQGRDTLEITEGVRVGDTVLAAVAPGGELPVSRRWALP